MKATMRKKNKVMFINTLIVLVLLGVITALPIILKSWLDPENDDKESGKTDLIKRENSACGGCALKSISSCSIS